MAEQQVASNVNISDVPGRIQPFQMMGLNALAALAFDPEYIKWQLANANITTGGPNVPGATGNPSAAPGDAGYNATARGAAYGTPTMPSSQMVQALQEALAKNQRASGGSSAGRSADAIDPLKGSLLRSADADQSLIDLLNVGLPMTGTTQPYPNNQSVTGRPGAPSTIGGGGGVPPGSGGGGWIPPITVPPNPGTGIPGTGPRPGGGSGAGNGSGSGGGAAGGASGSGGFANVDPNYGATPGTGTFTRGPIGGFSGLPTGSQYNPSQYASDSLASQLAAALGATVSHTNTGGPNGPPPMNVLDFGIPGSGNMLNAGLVNDMLTSASQAPFAADRLRDELAMLNRSRGSAWMPFKKGGKVPKGSMAERLAKKAYATEMPRFNVGGLQPYGTSSTTAAPATGPNNNPSYPMAPYQQYTGQRLLDFTANPNPNNLATSGYTRQAEQGMASIPSVFDDSGGINAGRDESGRATTNFGIANDQMDWAGNQVGNAMAGFGSIYDRAMTTPGTSPISNPTLMSAGQIRINPLNDYRMADATKWTAPGVGSSYMSPYMDAVTNVQRTRAIDDYQEGRGARNSRAVAAGAYGGSRAAIEEGVARRALDRNLQAIDANGLQQAYMNAQQQFNADRAATTSVDKSNLDAALQTQGLATQAGLSAAQSNQRSNVEQFGQLLQAGQEAERMRNQFGLQAQNQNMSAALQAMQGLTGAGTALSSIGGTRADLQRMAQQLEQARLASLREAGAAQDQRAQASLNLGYQDFQNQRAWPYQLMNFYMGQLNGVPVGVNQEAIQYQNYSPGAQIGGAITSGLGALGSFMNRN